MQASLFGAPAPASAASPDDRWRCAVMDPPWQEAGGGGRGAQNHYPLADVRDIRAAILGSGRWTPAEHAHLWCWYTDNFLPDALWLVDQLGFTYKRTVIWAKVKGTPAALDFETGRALEGPADPEARLSIGQYARGAHEGMLFCTRGRGQDPSVYNAARRDVPSVFFAPVPTEDGRRIHSRKPEAAFEVIEARSLGPRIEFFARIQRPGWLPAWGNEITEESHRGEA